MAAQQLVERTFSLAAPDGTAIACVEWLPSGDARPRGVVQVAHGLAEHCRRYRDFAAHLAAAGFAVYASDHRGHGQSSGPAGLKGHFADRGGWTLVLEDLRRLNGEIAARLPNEPRVLFGHSMGAFLARHYALLYPETVSGLIISASSVRLGALARLAWAVAWLESVRIGPRRASLLMDRLTFGSFNRPFAPSRTAFDWLSRDPAAVDRYVADADCGFPASPRLWMDQFGGVIQLESEERPGRLPVHLPVLLISGTRDPVSRGGGGVVQLAERYRAAGAQRVEVKLYPEGRHEMLNEINRAEVYADIVDWLDRNIASPR
jgi:alpha-beta hydrolase superfamily lysophospholipase